MTESHAASDAPLVRRQESALAPCVRIALGAAAVAVASCLHAAGLFLPVGPADVAPEAKSASVLQSASMHTGRAWERRVRIARQELSAARDDVESVGGGRLLLNVRDGTHLDVVVERTAPTKWGYSLSGRIAGGSTGFVTLVVHEEAVAGSIWTPDSAYEVSYLGGGVHAVRDVTNAPPLECGGALRSELSAVDATAQQSGTDDGSIIDILVVWTPKAEREGYGGEEAQVLSRIELLVAFTNDAFERSGAFVALNLVGAEEVDYVETDSSATDIDRLANPEDGYMDDVHDQRDAVGADSIYLLTARRGGRALGAFSVGEGHPWVFAHEVGHNFGIGHERREFLGSVYRHGFTTEGCTRTIMSYGTDCAGRYTHEAPFFASPWRYNPRDGSALGVSRSSKERGSRGPAEAVLTLNRNRHRIANLRPRAAGE